MYGNGGTCDTWYRVQYADQLISTISKAEAAQEMLCSNGMAAAVRSALEKICAVPHDEVGTRITILYIMIPDVGVSFLLIDTRNVQKLAVG